MAKNEGLKEVYLHPFLDGRDVGPQTALKHITTLEKAIDEIGLGEIATISGRYYAMDRDKRWERVSKVYQAMCYSEGEKFSSATEVVQASYEKQVYDEFVIPAVITDTNNQPVGKVKTGDKIGRASCREREWIQEVAG